MSVLTHMGGGALVNTIYFCVGDFFSAWHAPCKHHHTLDMDVTDRGHGRPLSSFDCLGMQVMDSPFDIAANARRMMAELCELVRRRHPDLTLCTARVDTSLICERNATLHMSVRWDGSPIEHTLSWALEPDDQLDTLLEKISLDITTAHDLGSLPLVDLERSSALLLTTLKHLIAHTNPTQQPTVWKILHQMLAQAYQIKASVAESFWNSRPLEASLA